MFVRPKSGDEPTIACPSMCAVGASKISESKVHELKTNGAARGHGASGVKLYPGSANAHDRRNGVPGVQ